MDGRSVDSYQLDESFGSMLGIRLSEYCVCTDLLFFVWLFSVSKDAS